MDCAVNQRLNLSERNCLNLCERYRRLVFLGKENNIACPECKSKDVFKKMSASSFIGNGIGKCATNSPKGFS